MQTILITTSTFGLYDQSVLEHLKADGYKVVLNPFQRKLSENEVKELIKENNPDGIIAGVEPLTKNVLDSGKNIKVISRCGIGMDAVDLEAAKEKGIVVNNTPDAPTIPVAELTMGIILGLLRKVTVADKSIKEGAWQRPMGNLLHAKTVGIIGCGRIGTYLGKLLSAFECNLLGYDIASLDHNLFKMVSKQELLRSSDIVTLHLPYVETCHHFIDSVELSQMKNGAVLVNAARGGLVNEAALYDALNSGKLSGAALDCYENEPYKGDLVKLDNVILTSHIGSYAVEGRTTMEKQAVNNLLSILNNR
jgi:D-3-phosphoglycerate dehydrogenase